MFRILSFLSVLFLLISCDITYDGETRLVTKARFVDSNNNPIANMPVGIDVGTSSYGGGDNVTDASTNANGEATMVLLKPTNSTYISYIINNYSDTYHLNEILFTQNNFVNYVLNLNTIILYKHSELVDLETIFTKTSTTHKELKNIKLEGSISYSVIDLVNGNNINDYYTPDKYKVLKNQTMVLKYTIIDYSTTPSTITNHTENVVIVNDSVIYTVIY